jgi:hypothetical protein
MRQDSLTPGAVYHIYNRGNNGEYIFIEARNYEYFMKLYAKYITPSVENYGYCILRNHFHLMVRIKDIPGFRVAPRSIAKGRNLGCLQPKPPH